MENNIIFDVLIVGGGPAGMTAALYAQRNGKNCILFEKNGLGGQIASSPKVENFPGTMSMRGEEFADSLYEQIVALGAEIEFANVVSVQKEKDIWVAATEDGEKFRGKTAILATGVKHRTLHLEHEEELIGNGISFCAVCDGDFYSGRTVCLIGGGNSALQEAVLLAEKCRKVIILQDLPELTGEEKLQKILAEKENVEIFTEMQILEYLVHEDEIYGVKARYKKDGHDYTFLCDGVFLAIGLIPENQAFADIAELNDYGYFNSTENCRTKSEGLFVAGDCRQKEIRQVTTAAADGTVAALNACRFLNGN